MPEGQLKPLPGAGDSVPKHVAIIMDGNGRWAECRGLPRSAGHKQGVETVRTIVQAAGDLGLQYLTLYSFSTENWNRPETEISELFSLLRLFIRRDLADLHKNNIRIRIIGRRNGLPDDILALLDEATGLTANNTGPTLVIAFNYGGRGEIVDAVQSIAARAADGQISIDEISEEMVSQSLQTADIPDPDLLIRTSGEVRISNFLLWQLAYSEMLFVDCLWPDFSPKDLEQAIAEYNRRTRKYGGLSVEAGS